MGLAIVGGSVKMSLDPGQINNLAAVVRAINLDYRATKRGVRRRRREGGRRSRKEQTVKTSWSQSVCPGDRGWRIERGPDSILGLIQYILFVD